MTNFDQQINDLHDKIQRKLQLEDQIALWQKQLHVLRARVDQLDRIKDLEQKDVDKLENNVLGNMMYRLLGTMDEKMDKERQEAEEAFSNYTTAAQELAALEESLRSGTSELEDLKDVQPMYHQVMEEKIQALEQLAGKESDPDRAVALTSLIRHERKRKSLREALLYCSLALHFCKRNLKSLEAAKYWSSQDASEDARVEPSKTEYLEIAAMYAESITDHLTMLQAKLAQMGVDPQNHLYICDYLRTPKLFMPDSLEPTAQIEQIEKAVEQIQQTQRQISELNEKAEIALEQVESLIFSKQSEFSL